MIGGAKSSSDLDENHGSFAVPYFIWTKMSYAIRLRLISWLVLWRAKAWRNEMAALARRAGFLHDIGALSDREVRVTTLKSVWNWHVSKEHP